MRRLIFIAFVSLLILMTNPAQARYFSDIDEILAGNFAGYGARQMGMGGAGIMSIDGTSLFYNPANLTRVPRIEVIAGFSYQKWQNDTKTDPVTRDIVYETEGTKNDTRLNSVFITIPYPTYRGSFVIGLGVARTANFDRISNQYYAEMVDGATYSNPEEIYETGGLYQWGIGAGIDLSPRLSFGGTLLMYTGTHDLTLESNLFRNNSLYDPWQQYLEYKYLGFGAKAGLSYQISRFIGMGITAELPVDFGIEQNATTYIGDNEDYSFTEYDLDRPFILSAGLIGRFGAFTFMADADYVDWTQLKYSDNFLMELDYNNEFDEFYREVVRFRLGGEYVIPTWGLTLRAGYFNDPLPYIDDYIENDRYGFSTGFGLLIDQVMMLDVAFMRGSYTNQTRLVAAGAGTPFTDEFDFEQENVFSRVYATLAYRF